MAAFSKRLLLTMPLIVTWYTHFSTAFADNSAELQTIWQNPYNLAKLNFLAKVRGFSKLYQSLLYQRYQKSKKREAHQLLRWTPPSLKTLDFKPFSYTFAKSFKNPMALFLNSRLCRCQWFFNPSYTLSQKSNEIHPAPLFSFPHLEAPFPSASSTIVKIPVPVYFPVFSLSVPGSFRMFRSGMDWRVGYIVNNVTDRLAFGAALAGVQRHDACGCHDGILPS